MAYLHDVFPTLCGLTGFEIPKSVETEDLTPVLKRNKKEVRNSMMYAYNSWPGDLLNKNRKHNPGGGHRAVRKGDFKLIISAKHDVFTYQLFNLSKDPWELNNLIEDKTFESVKNDLINELQKLMDENGDSADLTKNEFGIFDNPEDYNFKKK
ncbi:DUF4976 domain-containing protein [Lutibacter sp. A80]|nr:DUF4976 domain-containing protein [Lutibacter sp. A80]